MKTIILTSGRGLISLVALALVGGTGVVWAQKVTNPFTVTKPFTVVKGAEIPQFVKASTPDVLKGLQGVSILIEGMSDDAKKIGLTKDRIQSATELSLRRNGVPVLTEEERLAKPGMPSLYVNVNVVGRAFSMNASLQETVHLERDLKTTVIGATTWEKGGAGVSGDADYIVKNVERLVDEFCLDYLKANPK